MSKQEIRVELLLGKRVFAINGRAIGRLEEIRAETERGQCYVKEFLVGSYAMFERLSALTLGRAILTLLSQSKRGHGYRVPWDKLDLSNPERPRLLCSVDELPRLRE